MSDVFSKVIAILISAILMFLVPIKVLTEENNRALQTFVYTETVDFTDRIRNMGCLTNEMYLGYLNALNDTGKLYKVEIQHYYKNEKGESANYTPQILDTLRKKGTYQFKIGDVIKVKVWNVDGSVAGVYGGGIKDENY